MLLDPHRSKSKVESSWNVMAHGDAREGKWRGNWRMAWVGSTLHTTLEHGLSSLTTADAHTSAATIRLNWRPCRFKWTRPFRQKTKSGFCACVITFQRQFTRILPNEQCYKHYTRGRIISLLFTVLLERKNSNPFNSGSGRAVWFDTSCKLDFFTKTHYCVILCNIWN